MGNFQLAGIFFWAHCLCRNFFCRRNCMHEFFFKYQIFVLHLQIKKNYCCTSYVEHAYIIINSFFTIHFLTVCYVRCLQMLASKSFKHETALYKGLCQAIVTFSCQLNLRTKTLKSEFLTLNLYPFSWFIKKHKEKAIVFCRCCLILLYLLKLQRFLNSTSFSTSLEF